MTYNVSSGTLNTTIPYHTTLDLLIGDIGDDPERLLQLVFIFYLRNDKFYAILRLNDCSHCEHAGRLSAYNELP